MLEAPLLLLARALLPLKPPEPPPNALRLPPPELRPMSRLPMRSPPPLGRLLVMPVRSPAPRVVERSPDPPERERSVKLLAPERLPSPPDCARLPNPPALAPVLLRRFPFSLPIC